MGLAMSHAEVGADPDGGRPKPDEQRTGPVSRSRAGSRVPSFRCASFRSEAVIHLRLHDAIGDACAITDDEACPMIHVAGHINDLQAILYWPVSEWE
jgi:hypothetical protein